MKQLTLLWYAALHHEQLIAMISCERGRHSVQYNADRQITYVRASA